MKMNKPTSRLTAYDHDEICAAHRAGVSFEQLAREYNRKVETIRTIFRRRGRS